MLFSVIYYGKKYLQLHSVLLFDLGVCVISIESSLWVEWFPMFSRFAPQKQLTFGLSLPFTSHFLFVRVNHEWNHSQPYRTLLLFCFMIDLCQAQVSTAQTIFMLFESVKRDLWWKVQNYCSCHWLFAWTTSTGQFHIAMSDQNHYLERNGKLSEPNAYSIYVWSCY